jgi:hypothetical protein
LFGADSSLTAAIVLQFTILFTGIQAAAGMPVFLRMQVWQNYFTVYFEAVHLRKNY